MVGAGLVLVDRRQAFTAILAAARFSFAVAGSERSGCLDASEGSGRSFSELKEP